MNKTLVHITQGDIDQGIPRNGTECAAGRACSRTLGVGVYAGYGLTEVYTDSKVDVDKPCQCYQNGPLLTIWIGNFDRAEEVQPITIEFDHEAFYVEIV
jgi:hypothetical protein